MGSETQNSPTGRSETRGETQPAAGPDTIGRLSDLSRPQAAAMGRRDSKHTGPVRRVRSNLALAEPSIWSERGQVGPDNTHHHTQVAIVRREIAPRL